MKKWAHIWLRTGLVWLFCLFVIAFAGTSDKLSIVKVTERPTQTGIALCANLNRYIDMQDGIAAKPSIKLTPNHYFSVSLTYEGICLEGLKPRTQYQFAINKNIPLGDSKLDRDYLLSGTTTDYTPSLNFKDKGYILPAKGEISIPIETTNINELSVSLYRINTKNLIGKINDYGLVQDIYSWDIKKIADTEGYFLWNKRLKIRSILNESKVTAIPVGDFLKEREPGVYILQAQEVGKDGEVVNNYDSKAQWFMISDLGLFTLRSDEGLEVYTRKLSTAQTYEGVKLELISKNNELLDTIISKNGAAFFTDKVLGGKQGLKPKAIYAYGKNDDFSVIDLSKPAHDLSDRGVQGRDNPGRYDAYIYSNRGIFRPGETVPIHILLRNQLVEAQGGVKLSLKLFDSREVEIDSKLLTSDEWGHIDTNLTLSESSSTGKWYVKLYSGGDKPVGILAFLVEDFVPPKIKVDTQSDSQELKLKQSSTIDVSAHFLNGEALGQAEVEVNTIIHRAKRPFEAYKAYYFGDMNEEFSNQSLASQNFQTDMQGNVTIPFMINEVQPSSLPLWAHITILVSEPGGRPVEKVINLFLADKAGYIGIKPNFNNTSVDMGSTATFDLIYLVDSKLTLQDLQYRLVKEQVHWNWRSDGDEWAYDKTYSDAQEMRKGTLRILDKNPTTLTLQKLDWGSYRLEVESPEHSGGGKIISTYRFTSGYEESTSKASPDRLPIAIDKQSYHIGDQVRVNITPKFDGPVMLYVANHSIIETKTVDLRAGEAKEVVFTVDKNWGNSIYILATAFRAESKKLGANRAIGLAHVQVINPNQVINLSLEYQKQVKSSQPVKVTVTTKEVAGKRAFLTLAAVDDGVLRLTGYEAPDPKKYFFGQQKLGIEIRDIYADLIKAVGAHAVFNVGAGDDLEDVIRDTVVSNKRKVVALFTGALAFDKEGKSEVTLDIPDYQGSLKLMAVAWSKNAVGSQSGDIIVKDSIAPEIYMPRFISVGDRVKALVRVDFDRSAKAGNYTISFGNENKKEKISQKYFNFLFDGLKPAHFSTKVELGATSDLDDTMTLAISQNGVLQTSKQWQLGVRTKYPQVHVRKVGLVDAQALFDPRTLLDDAAWSDIGAIGIKLSSKPLLPVASIADELISYQGRCAEQTTSRAMPWLFMPKALKESVLVDPKSIIQPSVDQLLDYQKLDGGFGLWSGSSADVWISAYVLDFLIHSKKAGYEVPERNIDAGLDWIENNLDRWSNDGAKQEADAYALYILALSGRTLMSEILFHANDTKSKIQSAQAWGHLGAALAYVGEKDLAVTMFDKAKSALGHESQNSNAGYYANYGGSLRDEAALVVLMHDANLGLDWESLFSNLALDAKERNYLSTQEMSLLLRAAYSVDMKPADLMLSTDGKSLSLTDGEYTAKVKTVSDLKPITNQGSSKCWYELSFKATPAAKYYSSLHNQGFTLSKKIYTMQGKEADLETIKQNDRLVVVIQGEIQNTHTKHPLITDWLPSGFELENPIINGVDATSALKWLGNQSKTEHVAYRDDRYEAALSHDDGNNTFLVAYVVRVVSAGSFTLPPSQIEDMYQPYLRALSTLRLTQITIKDPLESTVKPHRAVVNTNDQKPVEGLKEKEYLEASTQRVKNLDRYTITQINFLRNAIFAKAGFNFEASNPMLHQLFSAFSWYHPGSNTSAMIYKDLTPLQKENVQALLNEEKRRGGGLVLNDFYRVNDKVLSEEDLKNYDKKQLSILRNSLFARRGVAFGSPELTAIFTAMPWYKPTDVSSSRVFDELMSEQEKANVKLIQMMEKR